MALLTLLPRCCRFISVPPSSGTVRLSHAEGGDPGHEELDRGADRVVGDVDVAEGEQGAERRVPVAGPIGSIGTAGSGEPVRGPLGKTQGPT